MVTLAEVTLAGAALVWVNRAKGVLAPDLIYAGPLTITTTPIALEVTKHVELS